MPLHNTHIIQTENEFDGNKKLLKFDKGNFYFILFFEWKNLAEII